MDLITDTSLCNTLGFDLDSELSNVRRYAKTQIKNLKGQIQTSLDALSGEVLEPINDITDKIESSVNDMLSVIADNPFTSAAAAILSCINSNVTLFDFSLSLPNWKDVFDKWLLDILDSFLSASEKSLWSYLSELDDAVSPYILDKIMALAACLIACPGVSGSVDPGADGWGVITPQGWTYVTESEFTDLINTIGLGTSGKVDFSLFGTSGSTYGARIRTIQDNKNKVINALTAVATGSVAPDTESTQVIDDYDTLVEDVEEAYTEYLDINSSFIDIIALANSYIREVESYREKVYKLGTNNYKIVADDAKTKMLSIFDDINTIYGSAIANNSAAETAYNDLALTDLQALNVINSAYLNSANVDKNRIKLLNQIVNNMSNALEDKGTIGGSYSGGIKVRGRAPIKDATGTGSYQEEIDAV